MDLCVGLRCKWLPLLLSSILSLPSAESFNPTVDVESCTKATLIVNIEGAESGGIIYIQGQGENCKQTTQEGTSRHQFDFAACGIAWQTMFKLILQERGGLQTGKDKQIPVLCLADESDLVVDNLNYADDKGDDIGQNMTVRPWAYMSFFKVVSDTDVSGQEVKLTDTLLMMLSMGNEWIDDFDIKARYCLASTIVIIDDFCATDTDLFPNFQRFKRGMLLSQFGAFRTTSLEGGPTLMNFSCVLQVCRGDCQQEACDDGNGGWGRRRRDTTREDVIDEISVDVKGFEESIPAQNGGVKKRNANGEKTEYDIDVGGEVKIVEKYSDIQIVTSETFCMNIGGFAVAVVALSTSVMVFGTSTFVLYKKWSSSVSQLKKISKKERYAHIREILGNSANLRDTSKASERPNKTNDFADDSEDSPNNLLENRPSVGSISSGYLVEDGDGFSIML